QRHDDVYLEANQLARELGKPIEPGSRETTHNGDVLPLDVAEVAQAPPERLEAVRRTDPEKPYPVHCPRRLSVGGARRREEGREEQGGGQQLHEPTPMAGMLRRPPPLRQRFMVCP